jgi:hypothetical protein
MRRVLRRQLRRAIWPLLIAAALVIAPPAMPEADADGIHVGQRLDGVHRFRGSMDEVRVHARALTAPQITSIREFNKPIKSGPRLWLRLDAITPLGGER